MPHEPLAVPITVTGGVSMRTREPFITLRVRDVAVQMPPHQAAEIGMLLLEVAERSVQDTFLLQFLTEDLHTDEHHAAVVLRLFRDKRQAADDAYEAAAREEGSDV